MADLTDAVSTVFARHAEMLSLPMHDEYRQKDIAEIGFSEAKNHALNSRRLMQQADHGLDLKMTF